ncbi:MAG: amino acid ABC transporter permease [Oscillospiraceae bacterium]|nr:amino acid ABC transporter permease [Oscillospiraceae bacterium]
MEFIEYIKTGFHSTFIVDDRYKLFLEGLGNTVYIAIFATIIGVIIGSISAIVGFYVKTTGRLKPIGWIINIYVIVIRGTPLLIQLLITYFIIFSSSDNAVMIAIIAFGLNSGAYVCEVIRAGILSVDKGQGEAGASLGLNLYQIMRFIQLPQAIKNILPALGNEFINIVKETSVAGYIAIVDLTKAGDIVRSQTFDPYFSLLSVAGIYLIIVSGLSFALKKWEKRLSISDRS